MKTYFYNRSAFTLMSMEPPQCFLDMDGYFDTKFGTFGQGLSHKSVMLAENLSRRMADVELYSRWISEAQKNADKFRSAILIGTLMVGYFSACKSLLDASSVSLATLYGLTLKNKEMDFSKPQFWRQLRDRVPRVHCRYKGFSDLFKEVVGWRDASVHRDTPLVVVHTPGDPNEIPSYNAEIKVAAQPDAVISGIVSSPLDVTWVEPLHFHKQWQPRFVELCERLCQDIQANT